MEDVILSLVPLITSKIADHLSSSSSPSAPSAIMSGDPLPVPSLPIPRDTTPVQTFSSGSSLTIPFQQEWYGLTGTETGTTSITLTELKPVKKAIESFRNARLQKCEVVIFAAARSVKDPVTVDLAWTPSSLVLDKDRFLDHPGAVSFTVGGLNITNGGLLPAPLQYLNPVIKSPIPYTDAPRLCAQFHQVSKELGKARIASVVIRGEVVVDTPTVY